MTSNKKILTCMYCFSILLNAMTMCYDDIVTKHQNCITHRLTIIALLVFVVSLENSYRINKNEKRLW